MTLIVPDGMDKFRNVCVKDMYHTCYDSIGADAILNTTLSNTVEILYNYTPI